LSKENETKWTISIGEGDRNHLTPSRKDSVEATTFDEAWTKALKLLKPNEGVIQVRPIG